MKDCKTIAQTRTLRFFYKKQLNKNANNSIKGGDGGGNYGQSGLQLPPIPPIL